MVFSAFPLKVYFKLNLPCIKKNFKPTLSNSSGMQSWRDAGWLTEEVYFNSNQLKRSLSSEWFWITSEMKSIFILITIHVLSHMKSKFFLIFNNTVWKYSILLILKMLSFWWEWVNFTDYLSMTNLKGLKVPLYSEMIHFCCYWMWRLC